MTYKERKAKRTQFFSLKAYLYKKAQLRALKLQFRQARRNAKKEGHTLTFADYIASLQPATQEHSHEHHEHVSDDEPLVIHEDDLAQTT
jgi:hypothetical protein